MAKAKQNQGLSRAEHLRTARDFQRVFERRCSANDEWLQVYGVNNGLPYSRLGLSVGRKWGPAVVRNRIRRLYREAYRLTKSSLPQGLDLVFVPRKADGIALAKLLSAVPQLIQKVSDRLARSRPPR